MGNCFELIKKEEERRGEKYFISIFSSRKFDSVLNIEKYVAVKQKLNFFVVEGFSSNFDFTKQINEKMKSFYLGDDDTLSYYLLNFIVSNTMEPKIEKKGVVTLIDGKSYLPLPIAFDLCVDQKSRKLIESISKINVWF